MKRRRSSQDKKQTRRESLEMKDSRLYAEARRKGPPKAELQVEPTYEEASQGRVYQPKK